MFPFTRPPQPSQRVIKFIHHSFFQRNNPVVRDLNLLRTNLGAAFRDVALPDPVGFAQLRYPIFGIERVHLQGGRVNQETRPDKAIVHLMIAQDVADILTKKTLDTFPELLHPIDVFLLHPPGPVWCVGRSRLKRLNLFLHLKVPGDVGDQVFQD